MTTDPPIAPADLCEIVARLIFDGLPVPAAVALNAGYGRPTVQVMEDALDEWTAALGIGDGEWERYKNQEHYRGRAVGFDLIAVREHVCEPVK